MFGIDFKLAVLPCVDKINTFFSDRYFYYVNIRLFVNNILNVHTHNIRKIFLRFCKQNSWLFQQTLFLFWWRKLVPKKLWKNGKQLNVGKGLTSVRLRLVVATFDSKVAYLRGMRKKNLIILSSLQKKSSQFFVLFVCHCWHLICQISIESIPNICNMITERHHTVLYLHFFCFHFYWAIFNWNFIWSIDLSNDVYCDYRNKSACLYMI